jgi:hypothetical protein
MESTLESLTGRGYAEALASRGALADIALAARSSVPAARLRASASDYASVDDYVADLARRSVCLTLLAGSGSRWVKSLAPAAGRSPELAAQASSFDPRRPRGLFPVRDFLTRRGFAYARAVDEAARASAASEARIPIASYALAAVHGLGRHLLVVRGWEAEIDAEILAPLGIAAPERDFFTQAAPFGKPLGHGDAAWQCRELFRGADYVVANFGGDANSRRTILSSLLALDALRALGREVDLLIPATRLESPAYPIGLDAEGLPTSFGHAKLQGAAAPGASAAARAPGYTNVGVRVYSAPALLRELEDFRSRYWVEGQGYAIPGNDPEGHEFALDNVDAKLSGEGRARILAIARPAELTPAKCVDDIPAFEAAIESVVAEDSGLIQ